MGAISRWEVFGVPAALVFSSLYELGVFSAFGLTEHHVPHLMTLAFIVAAAVRGKLDKKAATKE